MAFIQWVNHYSPGVAEGSKLGIYTKTNVPFHSLNYCSFLPRGAFPRLVDQQEIMDPSYTRTKYTDSDLHKICSAGVSCVAC